MFSKADIQRYADEVMLFAEKYVKPTLDFLRTNEKAVAIETAIDAAIPQGGKIVAALGGINEAYKIAAGVAPHAGQIFAVYEVAKSLGFKPADQAFFDNLEKERGSQE